MVITETTQRADARKGFARGLAQVKMGDYRQAVEDLYRALGINNRTSFAAYRDGKTEPKMTQAEAVEGVFNRYGVTKNIWGV